MRFKRRQQDQVELNLTPLIDVVFLLLIFFVVSTSFAGRQLSLQLPEATSATSAPTGEQIQHLVIYADGRLEFNQQEYASFALLEQHLEQQQEQGQVFTALLIEAARTSQHQLLVNALDMARRLQIEQVRIATQTH